MSSVHLVESPKQILGGLIHVISSRVVRKVVAKWRAAELLLEDIDLVEKENNTRAHEPPRVDDGVE